MTRVNKMIAKFAQYVKSSCGCEYTDYDTEFDSMLECLDSNCGDLHILMAFFGILFMFGLLSVSIFMVPYIVRWMKMYMRAKRENIG